jgi:hypothetical protein
MTEEAATPVQKRRVPTCLAVGCGLLAIATTLLGLGGWWAYQHFRQWAASAAYTGLEKTVDEAPLEEDQRVAIKADLKRLCDGFAEGRVGMQQLEEFVRTLSEGPFFPMAGVIAAEKLILEPADLTADEKIEGRIHLERVARGLHEKTITKREALAVLDPVDSSSDPDDFQLKESPTPEEVRAVIAAAKAKADEKEIPVEPFEVDMAAEIDKAVDAAFE